MVNFLNFWRAIVKLKLIIFLSLVSKLIFAECLLNNESMINNSNSNQCKLTLVESSAYTRNYNAESKVVLHSAESTNLYHQLSPIQVLGSAGSGLFSSEPNRSSHKLLPEHYLVLPTNQAQNLVPLLADIVINKFPKTTSPILVYSNERAVCFSDNQLIDLKIIDASTAFFEYFEPSPDPLHQNSLKCALNESNGVTLQIDQLRGTVSITLPVTTMQTQNINLGLNNEATYPTNPAISNNTAYQLSYNQNMGAGVASMSGLGTFINTTSTSFGSLMNGFSGGNQSPLTRQYTYWQTDFPEQMTSAVIGDASQMVGSWGNQINYAGIQYGSNVLLRPGYFFTATPLISGSVSAPSTAEVLLNNGPVTTTDLAPGPFNLYNLPIINGDGTVTVNLKDPNGNTYQSVNLPYYTSPKVLQDTTYLYQYSFGMPRTLNDTGWNANYQTTEPGISTQHFIALTNQYTMEVHGEAQLNNFANLGLSHNVTWLNAFSTSLSTALSTSESGNGILLGFNLSRQTSLPNSIGFGYSASAQSPEFQMFGQQNGLGTQIQQTVYLNYLSSFGLSVAGGYTNNSSTSNGSINLYNATMSWQFLRNFVLTSTTYVSNGNGIQTLGTNLGLNVILDSSQSINSNFSYANNSGTGTTLSNVDYQYLSPSNVWGGNLIAGYATGGSGTPSSLGSNGYYLAKNFNLNAQAAYNDSNNYTYGGNLSGNMVVSSAGLSMGQYSTLSFIVVRVGKLANVGIKQNGSVIGTTDMNGSFVIPNVTPYLSQDIEVNALDLPFNTELDSYEKRVVAPLNGGTVVTFIPVSFIPAFVKLSYGDNEIPPTGYEATLYNSSEHKLMERDYIIDGGSVQLSKFSKDLNYELEFTVKEGTYTCAISQANIQADSNQYLYNLGEIKCIKK